MYFLLCFLVVFIFPFFSIVDFFRCYCLFFGFVFVFSLYFFPFLVGIRSYLFPSFLLVFYFFGFYFFRLFFQFLYVLVLCLFFFGFCFFVLFFWNCHLDFNVFFGFYVSETFSFGFFWCFRKLLLGFIFWFFFLKLL